MSRPFEPNLWAELESDPAPSGVVQRRILPKLQHDVFIGEDRPSGLRQLTMSIQDTVPMGASRGPNSRGLDVRVATPEGGPATVQLAATSLDANALFAELAEDVAGVLQSDPGEGAATRVLQRVMAWQSFFAKRSDGFGPERAAGLFAELEVLRTQLVPVIGPAPAVSAWHGPDPALQDFQLGHIAMEVKSFRGNGPGVLDVSSERQLEGTGVDELYVAYLRLDQRAEGNGITLANQVAHTEEVTASSFFASDLLRQKLLEVGWHESVAEIRTEKYEVRSSELFAVTPEFPRIVSTSLPPGVGSVKYSVDRSAIENFLFPWDEFTTRMVGET